VAPSTAGAQVPHLSPTLQPPINISSNIIIVITTFSRFIIATTALYGELGRGNVSSVYQSPAAIACTRHHPLRLSTTLCWGLGF
jgi:hypothetical protein